MTDRDALLQIQAIVNAQLSAPVIHVPAGSDLQVAIDAAPVGAVLSVDPGDYAPIRIDKVLTVVNVAMLPDRRVTGDDSPTSFVRIAATGQPAITLTAPATVIGVYATRSDSNPPIVDIHGEWSDGVAGVNKCWIRALEAGNVRGVAANGCATLISQSRIENIWFQGQDAQAVCSWTGPGPLTIDDCYLEGSTETVLLGGADPIDAAHQPKNFTLRKSLLTKQLAYRAKSGMVKNALEFKNCIGFVVEDNIIEYAWLDGQAGFLLVLTPRNQDGRAEYSNVANGVIQRNLFRHGGSGINMLGTDNDHPSGRMANIRLLNNRFEDIDSKAWGGDGRMCQLMTGPDGIVIDHNSFIGANLNSFISFANYDDTLRSTGLVYTNNCASEGAYGALGDTVGAGVPALDLFAPGCQWNNVALLKQSNMAIAYPATTEYVADEAAARAMGAGASGYPSGA